MDYSSFSAYLRGFFRGIGYALSGAALILFIVLLEKERFVEPLLKEYISEFISSKGGPLLKFGNIRGNYYSEIDFKEISLVTPDPLIKSLKLPSFKLTYSIWALLSGVDAFLSELKVNISGGRAELSLEPKSEKRASAKGGSGSRHGLILPSIRADDLSLIVNRGDRVISVEHARVEISGLSRSLKSVKISIPEASIDSPPLKQKPFSFKADLLLSRSHLKVVDASFNKSTLTRSARVDLGEGGVTGVKGEFNLLGGKGSLTFSGSGGVVGGHADFEGINIGKLRDYLSVEGLPEEGFLDITLDIEGRASELEKSRGRAELHLRDIRMGENLIDEAELKGRITASTVFIENASLGSGENRVDVRELRLPRKSLFQGKILKDPRAISGEVDILLRNVPELLSIIKTRPPLADNKYPEHEFSAKALISDGTFHIKEGYLKSGVSRIDIGRADIPLFTRGRDSNLVPVSGEGRIMVKKLTDISDLLSISPIQGTLAGDLSVSGTLAEPNASFSLRAENVSRNGLYFDSLELDGKVEKTRVSFFKIEALRGKDELKGRGSYDILKKRFERAGLSFALDNISFYRSLINKTWIPARGKLRGSAEISGSFEKPQIITTLSLKKWKYPKISLYSGEVRAMIKGGSADIGHFQLVTSKGDLRGKGVILTSDEKKAAILNLTSLSYIYRGGKVKLLSPANISLGKRGDLELNHISLAGVPARVDINGKVSPETKFDINLALTGGTSVGIPEEWLPSRIFFEGLELNARLTGSLLDPELSVSGKVERVGGADGPLFLRGLFGFELSRAGIHLSQFNFNNKDGHRINLGGRIPFKSKYRGEKFREIRVDGDVSIDEISALSGLFLSGPLPSGAIISRISVRGTPDEPTGELHIHTNNLSLPFFKYFPFVRGVTGDIDLNLDKRRVNIDKVSLLSEELGFSASGSWRFGRAFEQILNGEKISLSDSLDTSGELTIRDIGLLTGKVKGLRSLEGGVTVKGHLSGPIAGPKYRITLFTKSSKIKTNTTFPSFSDINGKIAFANGRVDPELGASLGGSPVSLVGTLFLGEKPKRFNIRFEGDNILYFRKNGLKVRGNTSLHLSGDSKRPELTGELALTDSKFIREVDFFKFLKFGKPRSGKRGFSLFSLKTSPFKETKLDISITSREPFVVKNSFVRGTLRPELTLSGTGEDPLLDGNIYIDPTIFQLPYGNLKVTSGVIRFLETSPDKPTVDLNAEGKLLGYDISLHAEGPYNEPVVTLSSIPPLPEDELLLLVLAGELPKDSAGGQKKGIGLNVAVYLSRSLLLNWFKSDSLESDESLLDRFDIEIGRSVTEAGAETVEAKFLVERNIMGRFEEWYLTSERDTFDDFNSGVRVVFKFE